MQRQSRNTNEQSRARASVLEGRRGVAKRVPVPFRVIMRSAIARGKRCLAGYFKRHATTRTKISKRNNLAREARCGIRNDRRDGDWTWSVESAHRKALEMQWGSKSGIQSIRSNVDEKQASRKNGQPHVQHQQQAIGRHSPRRRREAGSCTQEA